MTETTDPQAAPDTVTVASQSIELLLTGKPDVKYKWGSGSIQPSLVIFTYRQEGIHAHLYGVWVREDGELTDEPCDQLYRVDDTDWPDWLATLAAAHDRAELSDTERQFLTFALDQAAEEMSLGDGFTDEDRAALEKLRRMAGEAQQPETQAGDEPSCTCAAAGDCFAPAGHYADCPAAVSQPGKEA